MTGYPLSVLPQHVALLEASAITPEVARARGYVTADSKAMLGRHGFKGYQQRAPALLIPLHHADRSTWGYQARPDEPRLTKAGKVIKYETPAGQRNGIDIPPGAPVGDPSVPLLVTEGTRKADAAVSAGLCCVALPGVWGWRGTNANGGKVAVADWNDVALGGRRVVLAFDSDVATKRQVQAALRALAAYLASKGASVEYLHLPDEGDGKTGLDDYLAARGADGIWELVRPEPPALRDGDRPLSPLEDVHTCTPPPAWASDQDILRRMVCALRVCMGLVGENRNAKLLYLAFTSRLLGEPVNIAVKGLSSSGKSYTVECVARLFPDEAIYTMTAMSERALIYLDESLAHRTVVLYEAAALRENREKAEGDMAAYVVRSLLSEGRIVYPTVIRGEDGKLRTHKITKDGPTNLVTTTTSIRLHSENETRMLSLPSNDSAAQTREVLRASSGETKRAEADLTGWHGYQRWLARANHDVVIPYAACIAEQIPRWRCACGETGTR